MNEYVLVELRKSMRDYFGICSVAVSDVDENIVKVYIAYRIVGNAVASREVLMAKSSLNEFLRLLDDWAFLLLHEKNAKEVYFEKLCRQNTKEELCKGL